MPLDIALYIVIIALGVVSYLVGHRDGYRKGRDSGFVAGHRDGQKKWIEFMEHKRGTGGLPRGQEDALLNVSRRVTPPARVQGRQWL